MLRNIALRRPDLINDFLHADLLITDDAQYFEPERMSNRLERTSGQLDMLLLLDQIE